MQGIPVKDKGQTDSYQRIEAPVRGGEGAAGKIPDGGRPVTERQNELDMLLIQNDQKQVLASLTFENRLVVTCQSGAYVFSSAACSQCYGRLVLVTRSECFRLFVDQS